jgi:Cd2+/Zn2+-exporting ATPase
MGGVLSIAYDDSILSQGELVLRVKQLGVSITPSAADLPFPKEAPDRPLSPFERARSWLTLERVEAIFVVITFLAMMLGLVADKVLGLPTLSTIAYIVAYATGGVFGVKAGLESLRNYAIDVDVLMVLAALGAAFVGAYFEGAMLLFLFSLSNVLQNFALGRTKSAIRSLMKMRPDHALVRRGSQTTTLPIERINVGDLVIVRPGERVPLDGVVVEGTSTIDQSSLTGESLPVAKGIDDNVFAGTINQQGGLEIRVSKLAKDSTIARLIKMVEEAQSQKAHTQRAIDKVEQYYAMGVIVFTTLSIIVPVFLLQEDFQTAFYRGMTILVAASPCAVVISTPATVLSAIGNGARKGILFKGGVYVEQAANIKVIAFDKTGTLTIGKPRVTDILPIGHPALQQAKLDADLAGAMIITSGTTMVEETELIDDPRRKSNLTENELLALAAAVEARSEHPLAQAVVSEAKARGVAFSDALAFEAETGLGVRALVDGQEILVGNRRYISQFSASGLTETNAKVNRLQEDGKTCIIIARFDGEHPGTGEETATVLGVIGIADILRPDGKEVVKEIKSLGIERTVMLTGDNARVARAIAGEVGVDDFYAELLPEEKMRILRELADEYGPVAMVGDGVNDAPALAAANIGIAMGAAGTDVALETADIVLMSDDLNNIPYVIDLSHATRKTLVTNLVFAFTVIFILVAAVFRVNLPLPLSVIGHEGSTVIVSLNGLRLLGYQPKIREKD